MPSFLSPPMRAWAPCPGVLAAGPIFLFPPPLALEGRVSVLRRSAGQVEEPGPPLSYPNELPAPTACLPVGEEAVFASEPGSSGLPGPLARWWGVGEWIAAVDA
ncbi:hypothetical protein GGTG_04374 [Gaeumannomyces tritici R3-111a-1]|uniref:Uncharacterized protein n=1 Tax=Gaeumannomyces tritici (strain R3-111a-1) TaxID=644352 RepID=J3NSX5_GAET3|nr:hypothetical protein GGTG_04374 [Gaeumannomyces tritici R3-111a-1]EJT79288.1 hypothetical protein GGTG_04374 [Gaeumannomyces tritici R3-111a-1]